MLTVFPAARKPVERADYGRVVLLGFIWVVVPFLLFLTAQQHIDSALAGMLNASVPILSGRTPDVADAMSCTPAEGEGNAGRRVWREVVGPPGLCRGVSSRRLVRLWRLRGSQPQAAVQ